MKASYTATTKLYALEQILAYHRAGRLDFNLDCQRGIVWNEDQKQAMVDTLVCNERIPEIHVILNYDAQQDNVVFQVADGKQRLSTILDFLENHFPWDKKYADDDYIELFENQNSKKLYFRDLPTYLQKDILQEEVTFATYSNLTDKGIVKLFRKLNNGTALSTFQKGIAGRHSLRKDFSDRLLVHPATEYLWSEKVINKDAAEDHMISLLVLWLAYLDTGKIEPIPLDGTSLFNPKKNPYFIDCYETNQTIIDTWCEKLRQAERGVEKYFDILQTISKDKNIHFNCSKFQFIFPIIFAEVYHLSDKEFINLFLQLQTLNCNDVISTPGTNYSAQAMKTWISYIKDNYL